MIRRARQSGHLTLPISSLEIWAQFNGVKFDGIRCDEIPGSGSGVVADRDLKGAGHEEHGGEGPLMTIPKELVLSLERVKMFALADQGLSEVLGVMGEFGRVSFFPLIAACPFVLDIAFLDMFDSLKELGVKRLDKNSQRVPMANSLLRRIQSLRYRSDALFYTSIMGFSNSVPFLSRVPLDLNALDLNALNSGSKSIKFWQDSKQVRQKFSDIDLGLTDSKTEARLMFGRGDDGTELPNQLCLDQIGALICSTWLAA